MMADYIGIHGHGCCGPCYRNPFGVAWCAWCGAILTRAWLKRHNKAGGSRPREDSTNG